MYLIIKYDEDDDLLINIYESVGKTLYFILDNNKQYTGCVENVDDNQVTIRDKYNNKVFIDINKISAVEDRGGKYDN